MSLYQTEGRHQGASRWAIAGAVSVGFCLGFVLAAIASDGLDESRIKAGVMVRAGIEYRITPAVKP